MRKWIIPAITIFLTLWTIFSLYILLITFPQIFNNNPETTNQFQNEQRNRTEEANRCKSYGFEYNNKTILDPPRRLFVGSLIADDSWDVIEAIALEGYGLYHTVSFIESNLTINGSPRTIRFTPDSEDMRRLSNGTLYGDATKVHVDYWIKPDKIDVEPWAEHNGLLQEHMRRDLIIQRWKMNGMKEEDIGILQDADETFTRDFLLAVQTCHIPEFSPTYNCKAPKLIASTLIFESSPMCVHDSKMWFHPDMMIGKCIDLIGNDTLHPGVQRGAMGGLAGCRPPGHGFQGKYNETLYPKEDESIMYPLWNGKF